MKYPTSLLLCSLLLAFSAQAETELLADLDSRIQAGPGLIIGGQPEPHEVVEAAQSGIGHVVNLRGREEFDDWDQARLVDQLGLEYHRIPIASADDLDLATVETFDKALAAIGDEPALMHCASGNRVGALFALRAAWLQGENPEAAIAIGRRHGLTGLEDHVRELLTADPGS